MTRFRHQSNPFQTQQAIKWYHKEKLWKWNENENKAIKAFNHAEGFSRANDT